MPKNRLAAARSPYLRQHEDNPVDWYEWGDEALSLARREDRPILLSIGYSACHWCHVMAHESFEDPAVAAQMNRDFVNIKVDREERPDLDQIYQLAVQLMGRNGGWPLTAFLTPDQKPFFVGTYFPPEDRYGMPGFPKILAAVFEAFRERRAELDEQAKEITEAIGTAASIESRRPEALDPTLVARATASALRRADREHGGFGKKPKFPNTMALDLLLHGGARDHVELTLDRMRHGGVFDQLGGGFHRYSTDERWLVPHFEKMLYDNALLVRLLADVGRGEPRFLAVAREVVGWLSAEMTAPDGAFYATQDADSVPLEAPDAHPAEGAFFVFTAAELRAALEPEEVAIASRLYGVTEHGNFEDPHYEVPGRSVLAFHPAELGSDELAAIPAIQARLLAFRAKRPRPFRDDKVLTSWNALMISGLVELAMATGDSAFGDQAARAYDAIVRRHLPSGRLLRAEGIPGFLDDHAYLANAALDLYELRHDPGHLSRARELVHVAIALFADESGGFFFTAADGEALVHRPKDPWDQAIPSAQAELARAMLRLYAVDEDPRLETLALGTLKPLVGAAIENPLGLSATALALDRLIQGSTTIVVVGAVDDLRTRALVEAVHRRWIPRRMLVVHDPRHPAPAIAADKPAGDSPRAYVCHGRLCSAPVTDPKGLAALL
ncbi:MAG: thioredoxin domain-containing protein [Myxococcales bacterium]|nr:thioredoxin domain-containing protein [Myxococcales bacterium]